MNLIDFIEGSMKKNEQWLDVWQTQENPAFHEAENNPLLIKFFNQCGVTSESNVFIPLCGMSHDIYWLSKRCKKVYGCELSHIAIEKFFNNNHIDYRKEVINNNFSVYHGANISLFCGDIFLLTEIEKLVPVDFIYDRAAFIALDKSIRQQYIQLLQKLLKQTGKLLLITIDFDGKQDQNPPFAISLTELDSYLALFPSSRLLYNERQYLPEESSLYQRGVAEVNQQVHLIQTFFR